MPDAPPAASPPLVSGRAFLGVIRSIKRRGGEDLLRRVVRDAGAETAPIFANPIAKMSWHPYAAFAAFLRSSDRIVGSGDLRIARELGFEAGKEDLGTILRVFVALASPERMIRSCKNIWPSYYRNAGTMQAVRWAPDDTVLRIEGFPAMTPAHCRLMEGWMWSTMETLGFTIDPRSHERACTSRGGEAHEFWCRWTRGKTTS